MLRETLRADVRHIVIELCQPPADQFRACLVIVARRIHGRNGDQLLRERDHLAGHRFHAIEHTLLGCAHRSRQSGVRGSYSFRNRTSSTEWPLPLRRISCARSRVGWILSRRFGPLISRQIECAFLTASSLVSFE